MRLVEAAAFDFRFQAQQPMRMPGYMGTAWRGGFGRAQRRAACITGLPVCSGCPFLAACVYPYIFGTPPGTEGLEGGRRRGRVSTFRNTAAARRADTRPQLRHFMTITLPQVIRRRPRQVPARRTGTRPGPDQTIVWQPPPTPRVRATGRGTDGTPPISPRDGRRRSCPSASPPNPAGLPKPTPPPAGGARLRAAPSGAGRGRAPLGDANGSRWGSRRLHPANPQHPPRGPQQRQPARRPRIEGGEPLCARSRRRHLGDHSRQAQASFLVPYDRLRSADDEGQPGNAAHPIAKAAVRKVQWLAGGSREMLPQFDPRQLRPSPARKPAIACAEDRKRSFFRLLHPVRQPRPQGCFCRRSIARSPFPAPGLPGRRIRRP